MAEGRVKGEVSAVPWSVLRHVVAPLKGGEIVHCTGLCLVSLSIWKRKKKKLLSFRFFISGCYIIPFFSLFYIMIASNVYHHALFLILYTHRVFFY